MAKLTLTFTDEHLKLIRCLRFKQIEINHERSNLSRNTERVRNLLKELSLEVCKKNVYNLGELARQLDAIDAIAKRSKLLAEEDNDKYYGIDTYDLFGADFWYQQMAYIIGCADQVIKGTEEDVDGPKYPQEVIEHLRELDEFLIANLLHIEDIVHQFSDRGGIKAGVKYVSYDHEGIWYTEEEWKNMKRR